MRRRYIYFLLTYFHNSSKKEHITKYSIKSTINSTEVANLPGPSSAPSARHVLVRPVGGYVATELACYKSTKRSHVTRSLATLGSVVTDWLEQN